MHFTTAHALNVDTTTDSKPTTGPTTDQGPEPAEDAAKAATPPTGVRKAPVVCTAHALRDD